MNFFYVFFITILVILIRIGDAVIFLAKRIASFIILCITKLFTVFLLPLQLLDTLRFKRLQKQYQKKLQPLPKKQKRIKPTIFFPLPFFTKLKYFTTGTLFSLVFVFIPLLFFLFIQDLPSPKTLVLGQIPQTTKMYDRNGTLLYQMYADQNRTIIPLSDVPKNLQDATIAIEDKDFYKHPGFDITAIIRSFLVNARGGDLQGGSTITQQLIKSALLTPETSIERKVKEIVLAFWAERMFSKQQILEMYFNQVSYGGTAWGIEAASLTYFGKHAKDLDLAESAFLAGIPRAPSIYSPFGPTPTLWKNRQEDVLTRMRDLGYITNEQENQAENKQLSFRQQQLPLHAPHFVMYVKDLLVKKYGLPFVERGGLTVITSLDLSLQDKTQKIVSEEVTNDTYLNLTNGAAMITNPKNGEILAMVGSRDFNYDTFGNVNVTTSLRQPGSSIKMVTYAAALSKGYTAATILDDSPVTYANPGAPSYSPVNYDGKFHGRPSLRIAFANSFNIPAVRTLNQIGIPTFVEQGKKMGITTWGDPKQYGLSITLGAAEVTMVDMTTLYGSVANAGVRVDANPIMKITDSKGDILEQKGNDTGIRVLDEGVAFIISNILADNAARSLEFGTNSPLAIPKHTVSVKTGTTDNKRDNWTFGYTSDRLVGVWVGNNNNTPMSQTLASGITGAAPIWNKIMMMLLNGKPEQKLVQPENVITKACLGRIEYFIKGTENSIRCTLPPSPSPSIIPSR